MSCQAYGTGRDTLFMIKSTECGGYQGDQGITALNPTTIPPLGGIDADGNPTSETDKLPTTKGADYLRSQSVMGAFQYIEGKSSISVQVDNEKTDFQDLNSSMFKREFFKGGETMTGTLELGERTNEMYWMGAALGLWDSLHLQYGIAPSYRHFEIWAAVNPDVLDTSFSKCDKLYKFINVTFDSANATFENPIKHSVPFSFSDIRIFTNWEDDQADGKGIESLIGPGTYDAKNGQTLFLSQEIAGTGGSGLETSDQVYFKSAYGPSNAPKGDGAHTRFIIALRALAMLASPVEGSLKIILNGKDPMGRKQTEEFFIADLRTALVDPIELLTNIYWDGPTFDITLKTTKTAGTVPWTADEPIMAGTGTQTVDIYSVDWKAQDGIPVIET